MRCAAWLAMLLLAACAVPGGVAVNRDAPALRLAADGLRPDGTELRIDFGRAKSGVIPAVTRLIGKPPSDDVTNAECGAGPVNTVSWDGLHLNFMNGDFLGWVADDPAFATTSGLRVGASRAALAAAGIAGFEETTLGTEFDQGGVSGLIRSEGPDAPVTALWAGLTCFFR